MRVSFAWFSAAALGLVFAFPGTSEAQFLRRWCDTCSRCDSCTSQKCTSCQPGTSPDGTEPAPSETNPELANALSANEQSNMDLGAASGPSSSTPGMLGDSYIAGAAVDYNLVGTGNYRTIVPYGGRYKCADNTGPVPTDRISFAYKHFHNALQSTSTDTVGNQTISNGQVDSYTLGFEKSFFEQWASLELRVPFYAGTVFSDLPAGGNPSFISAPNFGNLSFILKVLFSRSDTLAVGGGFGLDIPTADQTRGSALNLQSITYTDKQYYLAPFLAFLAVPNDDWWMQGVVQLSIVQGHNIMFTPPGAGGGGGAPITLRFQEQNMMFLTLNAGKWLYQNPQSSIMPGIAAIAELNWTATLDHTEEVSATSNNLTVAMGNFANQQHIFNLTTGLHFQLSPVSNLRVSGVAPLRAGNTSDNVSRNRYFDSEVSVQYNRYF